MIPLLLAIGAGAASAAPAPVTRADPFPRLVTAEWVRSNRVKADLVLLHVDRNRTAYDSAHAAGARFVAASEFTVTRDGILTETPPTADLMALLERLGISNRTGVVLYGDILSVARLFMTLDYLGHDRVAILDGGLAAWQAAGLPVGRDPPPVPKPGRFAAVVRSETIVTASWVKDHLEDPAVRLLDARSPAEYSGEQPEEGVSRPGHIPGAASLDWHTLMDGARFKPADELRALVRQAGLGAGQTAVTYCRVGTRASLLYFVLKYLGRPVRLYDGSLNEWSARPDLPVVRGVAPNGGGPDRPDGAGATHAVWETVVVQRQPATPLADYLAHLAGHWTQVRAQAKRDGLVTEYKILTGEAQPDDLLQWNVVLVTAFTDAEARRRFTATNGAADGGDVEGPGGKLARRQYLTVLREW